MGSNTFLWRGTESYHTIVSPGDVVSIGALVSHVSSAIFSLFLDLRRSYNFSFIFHVSWDSLMTFGHALTFRESFFLFTTKRTSVHEPERSMALNGRTHAILRRLDPFMILMSTVHEQLPLILLCNFTVYYTRCSNVTT